MKTATREARWFEYPRYGEAGVLERRSGPLPPPSDDEVTVEVITSGINHMDVFLRNGKETTWADEPWPRRSGSDFAGTVVATGSGVGTIKPGTDVVGHIRQGAHASFLNVPVGAVAVKPKNVSWEVAGGLYLAGVTALDILDELRIGPEDTIVVSAAAGAVGSIEVQLAKQRGARVIGTCGERNFDYLRQLGIAPVRYGEGIVEEIQRIARGPVTAFIDNFGKDGSDIADELGVPAARHRSSADRRDVELALLQDDPASVLHGTTQLQKLLTLAQGGAFRLLVSGLYPMDDIVEAYEDLARLHSRGKVVLATHPVTTYRTLRARDVFEGVAYDSRGSRG